MGKHRTRNKPFKPSDYNDPTEPLEPVFLPSYAANPAPGGTFAGAATVPAAQPYAQPFPAEIQPAYPYPQPSAQAAYPVLPPAPQQKYYGSPPGGAPATYQPGRTRRHHSPLPGLVGLFFLLVQLVLLARGVFMLLNVQNTTLWLTLLFAAGDLFVQPIRWLAANVNFSVLAGTQLLLYLEFLVAVLAYGILSRLLVRLLRAFLN